MLKKIKILLMICICIGFAFLCNNYHVEAKDDIIQNAKSGIAIELDTGKILYAYDENTVRFPASTTKIMTLKLIFDAIKNNKLSLDQTLVASEYASHMGGSQIYLSPKEEMKVSDLLKSVVIASANDAAVVLAEAIAGTESSFVKMMNDEAKRLGLKNTNFKNATGLHDDNHYTTAHDLAVIARELLLNYEDQIIPISSTYEDYIRKNTDNPFWLVNTNKLIKGNYGIDGLKTGWTNQAGYCLVCTKKENGMRVITVVMGAENVEKRTADTLALMNYAYANYDKQLISPKGSIVETKEDLLYNPSIYNIVLSQDISRIVKKTDTGGVVTYEMVLDKEQLNNPNAKTIGKLKVYIDKELYAEVDLELKEKVKKNNFFELFTSVLESIF